MIYIFGINIKIKCGIQLKMVNQKILIADDSQVNRILLRKICEEEGKVEIVIASDGEEAVAFAQENEFSVILLDVEMPGNDGFETAGLIRKTKCNTDTPVIFITAAKNNIESIMEGYKAGAVDYLFKPVVPFILKSKVKVFLKLHYDSKIIKMQKKILEKKNQELNLVIDEIKALKGLIPICSWCKKIRTEANEWQPVEEFIKRFSTADFTHGVCPDCLKTLKKEIKNTK
jgi:CheY-like chemotaxis protein